MSRKVVENAILLSVIQSLSLGLPVVSLPYLANVLGVDGLGRVAFALSTAMLVAVLADYGFELSASRAVSVHRFRTEKVTEIWCAVTLIKTLLGLTGAAVVLAVSLVSETVRDHLGLIAAGGFAVLGSVLLPQWLFQGLEKLRTISLVQSAARLILFGAIFLFIRGPDDQYLAVLLLSAPTALAGMLALPHILGHLHVSSIRWPSVTSVIEQLQEGRHVFFSASAVNVYTTANTFLLGLFVPASALGYYHLADKGIRAAQAVYGPISSAVYPHVIKLVVADPLEALRFNARLLVWLPFTGAVLGLATFIGSPFAVNALLGPGYEQTVAVLKILAVLPPLTAISNVLGIQTMLPLRMDSIFTRILVSAAALNLLLFVPAVQLFGVFGAAWVNVIVEAFVVLVMAAALHHAGLNPLRSSARARTVGKI